MMGLQLTQATHEAEDRDHWRRYTRLSKHTSALPWHRRRIIIIIIITRFKNTHVKSFTVVKHHKHGHVTCPCRKARMYRTDLSLLLNVPV